MVSPYDTLPPRAFWRTAVVAQPPTAVQDLYRPKFRITPQTRVMTAGSSFAQHLHSALRRRKWSVVDLETPKGSFPRAALDRFGYGLFSARYGAIYSLRQMVQLLCEAYDMTSPVDPVWRRPDGQFIDAQRPSVEPDGYDTAEQVTEARAHHLKMLRETFERTDVLVFTLGSTDAWVHAHDGTVFPSPPGMFGAPENTKPYAFHTANFSEIADDLVILNDIGKGINPDFKLLLTISPVPQAVTATGDHALTANGHSKSVLRAAVGEFTQAHDNVDYFPSYEIATNPSTRGSFFQTGTPWLSPDGVASATSLFFTAHDAGGTALQAFAANAMRRAAQVQDDLQCEDVLLEAKNGSAG
jgi:hypothetical protein